MTRVIARSTSFVYKDTADPRTVGRELRVRAVLTGHVARKADMLVVRVELVDVATGSRLWGNTYRRPRRSSRTVPGDVAGALARELRTRLTRRTGSPARAGLHEQRRTPTSSI